MKKFYIVTLAAVLISYGCLFGRFFSIGSNVMPVDEDETQHYDNARNYGLYSSIKASDILDEDVSKVGECDWYGPAYPVFFGTFSKLAGNLNTAYIVANIILLLLVIVLISQIKGMDINDKLWLILALLITPSVLRYVFYFMPSMIDLFFATVLVFILFGINVTEETKRLPLILVYSLLVIIFACFKENFVFAFAGILPFAKSKKQFMLFLLFGFIGLVIVLKYSALFLAPAYVKPLAAAQQIIKLGVSNFSESMHQLAILFKLVGNNIKRIVIPDMNMHMYLPLYYLIFVMPVINLIAGYRAKNKLLLSLGLIAAITNIVFIMLYNTAWYFMIRISVPYMLINLAGLMLIIKCKRYLQLAWIILFGLMFPLNFKADTNRFQYMVDSYCKIKVEQGIFAQLKGLVGCNNDRVTTILYDQKFWNKYGPTFILAMPLADKCGGRIRYTATTDENTKFKLWGKLKVDYILSVNKLETENYKLLTCNKYYYLYKL